MSYVRSRARVWLVIVVSAIVVFIGGAGRALALTTEGKPSTKVTYHNQIARLMQRSCQECHRAGEPAPFTLNNYREVKEHAGMIRKVVDRGIMPPWFADPKVGHWANDRSLAARDKADLLAWIDAGAPEGDPADAPAPRKFPEGWRIGKPDAVFEAAQAVRVPAKGPIDYVNVVVPTNLAQDKWVSAVEVRVTQPQVVHHVLVFVYYPPSDPRAGDQGDLQGGLRGYFAALVPGQGAITFPADAAKLLPAGCSLVFQVHYTPDGHAVQDKPKIGFIYAAKNPAHELKSIAASTTRFRIPPGADNHEVTAEYHFKGNARLLSFNPHGHLRAKAWRYELVYPGGKTETVLEIPHYDFNWQVEYTLRNPIDVPAGTILRAHAWYDNSAGNPGNPDPTATVKYGKQTSDEMMIAYFMGYALP